MQFIGLETEETMDFRMIDKVMNRFALACLVAAGCVRGALAQDAPPVPPQVQKQADELMEAAKQIGPWENQYKLMEEAADNVFQKQNWTSEPDMFARQLMRQIGEIPPWNPMERNEAFLDAVQSRWNLNHDQRTLLGGNVHRETMMLTVRHFKDLLPIALDITRTRAGNKPFTPDQVQEWSTKLEPLMDEGLDMVNRITSKLEKTMTEEQRMLLEADMKALVRRHEDVKKLVGKWQTGDWSPEDWGLQNDPLHAQVMMDYRDRQAQRNALVDSARGTSPTFDDKSIASRESEWEKYVKWFCRTYECDDRQRSQADAILKSSRTEAINYRSKYQADIAKNEALANSAASPIYKAHYQAELDRLLIPIAQVFDRLKKRLHDEVLTTQQQTRFAPVVSVEPGK